MKIIPIFVKDSEGLHSVQYDGESDCEFYKLFDLWNDREFLFNFCKENEKDIFTEFWGTSRLEVFVEEIVSEANELESIFLDYSDDPDFVNSNILQNIFKPLNNYEYTTPALQSTKAKVEDHRYFQKPKLRLYALRVDSNTYILTGGCIKLVHKMNESQHTVAELNKIDAVKAYLKKNEIKTLDDLVYYYEQQ